jgi:hypothetical protein
MRIKLVAGVVTLFVMMGIAIGFIEFGPSAFAGGTGATSSGDQIVATQATATPQGDNPIARENSLPGTIGWIIPANRASTVQIQAYAGATSVVPGKSITFYVSTQTQSIAYRMDVYRLGWYGGAGARLMTSVDHLIGLAQGDYDNNLRRLTGCTSCIIDPNTHLIEANWKPAYTLSVPIDWTTGIYLAKFTDANGMQTYARFDVLGNEHSTYVAVTPDTTYAAYNTWGGYSLYDQDLNGTAGENSAGTKGTKVSFDRPYVTQNGAAEVLSFEIQTIRWMEQRGYDLSYISSVDLHTDPAQLLNHKAYISLGHDEYWTKEMRDGVETARNHGVGLIFMGADASYWQMRFEKDTKGVPDRTVVCYKVQSSNGEGDLKRDPLYSIDNSRVTAEWRDPILGRPENALVGIMFSELTHKQLGFPWRVSPYAANSPLLKNTGLVPGQAYGCGVVGYEWDRVFPGSPKGLHIIATTNTTINDGSVTGPGIGNSTYYIAPSGAMVFATGSIYWGTTLDSFRAIQDQTCGSKNTAVPAMQNLMANVMAAVIVKHAATN